ncbi:MAG: Xaa-Pro peptidase family protein [Planctomycetota bacterium]
MANLTVFKDDPRTRDLRARATAALASLTAPNADPGPITDAERAARRTRFAGLLTTAGVDAYLVESGATLDYLTGKALGNSERLLALVVFADGGLLWVTPGFEAERVEATAARAIGGDVLPWDEHLDPGRVLGEELVRRTARRVAVDPDVRARFLPPIERALGAACLDGRALAASLRGIKDEHELALMRAASERTQHAIRAVAALVVPGMTTSEVALYAHVAQEKLGLTHLWDLTLAGPSGAFPHGDGVDREIARGEVLLLDTGGRLHGYCSDTTRTWVVDARPSAEVVKVWNAVRDAQRGAYDALRPGLRSGDADGAARRALAAAGYDGGYGHMGHRIGHGIGTEVHEPPYLDGGSDVILAPGMVFTNEPGIYQRGKFGLRIEDICVITADGADHFGTWQDGPEAP